ncbi:SUN domain-containing protein 1 [Holothuria leucospilota]|uniref:SUN domain-containing protein 1 n=1 Tax=Holothuria leucospilota TaxID=206669 RepID=A0A9Q1C3S9_HOLLE|nr:SUN domain-containing protein 1 [Holothuria leucospilota]
MLSQDKTDYTYSRSPSYSLDVNSDDNMDNYDVPFMSRRSYKASYVPSVTPHSRMPPKDTASSRRRSARLAAQNGEDFPDHSVSTQLPSHATIKPSQVRPRSVDPAMGRAKVAPRSLPGRRSTNQSGLFSENDYGREEQSLTHLYGLDEFDDTELSDTESSQANQKYSSSSVSSDWSSEESERLVNISTVISVISTIIYTIVYIVTYVPRATYRYLTSRSTSSLSSPKSHYKGHAISSFPGMLSHMLYTLVTRSLLMDVWLLTRVRQWISSLGVVALISDGLSKTFYTSSSIVEQQIVNTRRRRRSGGGGGFPCWICLFLLLLPILSSLYLFWGFVPFLLPLAKNETSETEKYAAVSEGMSVILTGLGDDSTPPPGVAGAGCLQCLKREDLTVLIAGLISKATENLQSQILEQDKQILVMLKHGSEQEKKISRLASQVEEYSRLSAIDKPDHLSVDISLEKELAEVKAQMRTLLHTDIRDVDESKNREQREDDSVKAFRADMVAFSDKISDLKKDFESTRNSQAALEVSLQKQESRSNENIEAALVPVRALQDEFALKLNDLEGRVSNLANLINVLESSSDNRKEQINSLLEQINSVEVDIVTVKSSLAQLGIKLENLKSGIGKRDEVEALSELKVDINNQNERLAEVQSYISGHDDKLRDVETAVGILKENLGAIQKTTVSLEESVARDKDTFMVLLEKTSSASLEKNEELAIKSEAKLEAFIESKVGTVTDEVVSLRQTVDSHGKMLHDLEKDGSEFRRNLGVVKEGIKKNSDIILSLETKLLELSNALNSSDQYEYSKQTNALMVVSNLHSMESELRNLKSQVEGMQGLHVAVDDSSSVSEVTLHQLTELQKESSKMNAQLNDATDSIARLSDDIYALKKSLKDLRQQTSSSNGSPINFVDIATDVESVQGDIGHLQSQINEIKQENKAQDGRIDGAITGSTNIEEQPTMHYGQPINLVSLQSEYDTFQSNMNEVETTVASLRQDIEDHERRLELIYRDRDNQYILEDQHTTLLMDITTLKYDISQLKASTGNTGESSEVAAGLLALTSRVASVEAGFAAMKSDDVGLADVSPEWKEEVDILKENVRSLQKQQTAASGNLGVGAGFHSEEDIANLKDDLSKLNAQYNSLNMHFNDCCQNKSEILGLGAFSAGHSSFGAGSSVNGTGQEEKIKGIVYGILNQYSADKTGMVDYALESAGGSIVSTRCSETYTSKTALLSIFGIPLWYVTNSPRTVIQPDVHPGNCWAFKGAIGFLVIQLSDTIKPTGFTMEHIPKSLSPTGNITSAPKNFSVWSLNDEYDTEGVLLGEYVYDDDGYPVQVFPVQIEDVKPTMMVELKIHSNYGSLEYTCLYRFRVHGDLHRT